ncbi:MAG TPA: hypothetical protein VFY65_20825 [Longimicrobium sp.]|nr:hypothetical protein [Longimicrobium sp.]
MPTLSTFSLPAFIQDFPPGSPKDADLKARWNTNVSGWITQAMPASPSFFYDPISTDIPEGSPSVLVQWVAFPGRLQQFYSSAPPNQPTGPYKLTQEQIYSLADQYAPTGSALPAFQPIPSSLCPQANWQGALKTFGPYGPRGWLDEYCEWSAARDANGNLVRIDFACENPEYWNTLWLVSPETVRSLYESVLNWDAPAARQISVTLQDLQLFYDGQPVTDPVTGAPVYNPLNKWNSGPTSVRTGDAGQFSGGVMHLTSTPNTLQTELGLAGASTVQYQPPSGQINEQTLICCGNYGQEYRHSDPHIGLTVNQVVAGAVTGGTPQLVCLANPVGLYLQPPTATFAFGAGIDPSRLPGGAQASDVYQVLRGSATVADPVTGQDFPGGMILHAVVQIPSAWLQVYPQMTLADILVNNQPLRWAGQVAEQFKVGLYARPLTASTTPPPAACASTAATPGAPLQALYANVWDAFYNSVEVAPTGQKMSLASNTTFIAPRLPATGGTQKLVLTCNPPSAGTLAVSVLLPDGSGPDTSITVAVTGTQPVEYAVPGNSYPGSYTAVSLDVTVPAGAAGGLRGMEVVDPASGPQSFPAMVYIQGGSDA